MERSGKAAAAAEVAGDRGGSGEEAADMAGSRSRAEAEEEGTAAEFSFGKTGLGRIFFSSFF